MNADPLDTVLTALGAVSRAVPRPEPWQGVPRTTTELRVCRSRAAARAVWCSAASRAAPRAMSCMPSVLHSPILLHRSICGAAADAFLGGTRFGILDEAPDPIAWWPGAGYRSLMASPGIVDVTHGRYYNYGRPRSDNGRTVLQAERTPRRASRESLSVWFSVAPSRGCSSFTRPLVPR